MRAFLDVETTGTDPRWHQVWEVGLITRAGDGQDAEYCWQIRPDLSTADPAALRVGGYHERCQVKAEPVGHFRPLIWPAETGSASVSRADQLAALLDGAILIGVNVSFDRDFLAALLREAGQCLTASYHLVEVCSLAAGWLHGRGRPVPDPWRADDLAAAAGIDPAAFERHSALGDARFARAIYDTVTASTP